MQSKSSLKHLAVCCLLLAALALLLSGCQSPASGQTYAGTKFFTGTGAPAASLGENGDLYLDTSAGMVYVNTNGTWAPIASLKGAQGSGWLFGSGTPANTLGNNGDLYLDTTSTVVWKKTGGAWNELATLTGAGQWQVGQGNPNGQTAGSVGDLYLDLLSTMVYECQASGNLFWTTLFSFQVVSPQYIFTPDFLNLALNGVAYGSGKFVAVGYGGTIISTSDGVNWSYGAFDAAPPPSSIAKARHMASVEKAVSRPAMTSRNPRAVSADKLAALHQGALARKTAFRTRQSKGLSGEPYYNNIDLYGIASDGTNFAAVGRDYMTGQPVVVTSTDGVNWNAEYPGGSGALYGVTCVNGNIVAVGSSDNYGYIVYGPLTANPEDWDYITTQPGEEYYCATANASGVFVGGAWYGEGSGGRILFDTFDDLSPEGNWEFQEISPSSPGNVTDFGPVYGLTCANGGMVVAVGQSSYNQYSMILTTTYTGTDAEGLYSSWSSQDIPSQVVLHGVTYGSGGFIAVGDQFKLFTSANGIAWSLQDWAAAANSYGNANGIYFSGVAWGAMNGGLYAISQARIMD
jgi:hypothetical protein